MHFNLDLDRDKVLDHKDCRPFNPRKQHVGNPMKERLKNIPLYITDKSYSHRMSYNKEKGVVHIMDPKAKKIAPNAYEEVWHIINKYPSVVSDIEKSDPRKVLYSSQLAELSYDDSINPESYERGGFASDRFALIKRRAGKSTQYVDAPETRTFHHEMKHIEQEKRLGKAEMGRQHDEYPYDDRPIELEAKSHALQKLHQYAPREPKTEYLPDVLGMAEEDKDFRRRLPTKRSSKTSVDSYTQKPYNKLTLNQHAGGLLVYMVINDGDISKNTYSYSDILHNFFHASANDSTQQYDRILRKLETTGLLTRPKRGAYRITPKGKRVAEILDSEGEWYA